MWLCVGLGLGMGIGLIKGLHMQLQCIIFEIVTECVN